MQRRDFLKTAAISAAVPAAGVAAGMPRRTYRDSIQLSIIGFGGIVVVGNEQDAANRLVAESVDRGINYFDVAPSYFNGEAEMKLGIALEPYRKNVFLACKTMSRDAAGAKAELERSLLRLKTDHFDLYQFHAVGSMKDAEAILAPGGAAELFVQARKEGKIRYMGFSAHNTEAALHLMDHLKLDSVLFPVNYVNYSEGSFGQQILARAKEKGLARLALKAMAHQPWKRGETRTYRKTWYKPIEDPALAEKALRFTLSEDITAAIPPGEEKFYRLALDSITKGYKPLSAAERRELLASAKGVEPLFRVPA